MFQSSPRLEAGCNIAKHGVNQQELLFQSSPRLEAGCNRYVPTYIYGPRAFQSSPRLEAGCNKTMVVEQAEKVVVSILTPP